MADQTIVHIGENSPEQVAYTLMKDVLMIIEKKQWDTITREEYLNTYAECLSAVMSRRTGR